MNKRVRVRFAPSPTGGLHIGGVRTALFNYLFARHHGGDFILRIEDTDQSRFVEGAEQYIIDCLEWCGLKIDEGPHTGGKYAPYRQSERKERYRHYAERLVLEGYAYYAFDTSEELEKNRKEIPDFQYGNVYRMQLRNSLSLSAAHVKELMDNNIPYVIRIKMPEAETVRFTDMIRGDVSFDTSNLDDKVLLKADGMPTYHLAVVVDDYLMDISHVFRGEEWLPSAPVHILLWDYLGWSDAMPQWAHLPLILKPDGHGKLSKRDGDRLGFPVFAMDWHDPKSGEVNSGFRDKGFLPEAFINMLALLGWNEGTEQEIFTVDELIQKFSIERVSKAGAKFDYEKAKWFNAEWIKKIDPDILRDKFTAILKEKGISVKDETYLEKVSGLIKDRLILLNDFWDQSSFFFEPPLTYDLDSVKPRWTEQKRDFFNSLIGAFSSSESWESTDLELLFKSGAESSSIKTGEVMLPFRIMLVGGKFGPQVFEIAALLGREETILRIEKALKAFNV
ncbi:MAG: glutamyl-tRNA synthetase [Chitinophagaceae bacterium]|nr:glutamyl-tRNA synthetase [Chitinophagaceae bacterium]